MTDKFKVGDLVRLSSNHRVPDIDGPDLWPVGTVHCVYRYDTDVTSTAPYPYCVYWGADIDTYPMAEDEIELVKENGNR